MLTSSDLLLLAILFVFIVYSLLVTYFLFSIKDELDMERRAHKMTWDRMEYKDREYRVYRQALMFYAEDAHWDPLHNPYRGIPGYRAPTGSAIAADQGQTAQLALGDFFLAPDANTKAPTLAIKGDEGSLGKYFYRLGQP